MTSTRTIIETSAGPPPFREQLATEGIVYTDACPQFLRSKLYSILKDRAYLGEVVYQGY